MDARICQAVDNFMTAAAHFGRINPQRPGTNSEADLREARCYLMDTIRLVFDEQLMERTKNTIQD